METIEIERRGFTGLSSQDATSRLAREGYNELPVAKLRNLPAIALEAFREPVLLLLIIAGGV